MTDKANAKEAAVKKPPIETASWCFRDKEEDVHHDFAWTITNFSRKINLVPNGETVLFCYRKASVPFPSSQENTSSQTSFLYLLTAWTWSGSCVYIRVGRTVTMRNTSPYSLSLSPGHFNIDIPSVLFRLSILDPSQPLSPAR